MPGDALVLNPRERLSMIMCIPGGTKMTSSLSTLTALLFLTTPCIAQVHVKKNAQGLPRNGETCEQGLETIDEGIHKAEQDNAKIVFVCDASTYQENVTMVDGIDLVSEALGEAFTLADVIAKCDRAAGALPTIQGTGSGPAVSFSGLSKATRIRGFRITGGNSSMGGGLMIVQCKSVHVIGNCIEENVAGDLGGGLGAEGGDFILMDRNFFHKNQCQTDGGGIGIRQYMKVWWESNQVEANTSLGNGGGISVTKTEHIFMSGGGLFFNGTDGTGKAGGGGFFSDNKFLRQEKMEVTGHKREGPGGGSHYINQTTLELENSWVHDNEATKTGGGGWSIVNCKTVTIRNCDIDKNLCGTEVEQPTANEVNFGLISGGGIRVEMSQVKMTGGRLLGNKSRLDGGGALAIGNEVTLAKGTSASIDFNNVLIKGNDAQDDGGGVSGTLGARLSFSGDSSIDFNIAIGGNGGGIHASCQADVTFKGKEIINNKAKINGGGIYARNAHIDLQTNLVQKNSAEGQGGGVWVATQHDGGAAAIYCNDKDGELLVNSTVFDGNQASEGGAIGLFRETGERSITFRILSKSSFSKNVASQSSEGNSIRISLGDLPPAGRFNSLIDNCTFDDEAVQIRTKQDPGWNRGFYTIQKNTFKMAKERVGISMESDPSTVQDNHFINAGAGKVGTGILVQSSNATLNKNEFGKLAVGVDASQCEKLQVSGSELLENEIGVRLTKSGDSIQGNTFAKNTTAIKLAESSPSISGNTFQGNTTNIDKDAASNPTLSNNHEKK